LGCEVIPLYCEIDSDFLKDCHNPADEGHYTGLVNKVKKEKADLGMMFDGDGDRVGFVDEKGNIWLGDIILTLLIREIIPTNPGRKVIVEITNSEMVIEETKRLGGIPIFWKTGHALLDHKVHEENAILCGEMSCHYWIVDEWYGFDDAVYAMARVLQIISNSGKTLFQLVSELPRYKTTSEYRISCHKETKFQIVKELVDYFIEKCTYVVNIDGIRGYIDEGWFLIRASNTEEKISIRCEGKTKNGLEKVKEFVKNKIDEKNKIDKQNKEDYHKYFIDLDWNKQYDKN